MWSQPENDLLVTLSNGGWTIQRRIWKELVCHCMALPQDETELDSRSWLETEKSGRSWTSLQHPWPEGPLGWLPDLIFPDVWSNICMGVKIAKPHLSVRSLRKLKKFTWKKSNAYITPAKLTLTASYSYITMRFFDIEKCFKPIVVIIIRGTIDL